MKPKIRWWPWFLAVGVTVACGFYRGWDTLTWVLLAVVAVTGSVRAFYAWVLPRWARNFERMSPEQREKHLAGMNEEERRNFEEKLKDYGA